MKKALVLTLAALLLIPLPACGPDDLNSKIVPNAVSSAVSEQPTDKEDPGQPLTVLVDLSDNNLKAKLENTTKWIPSYGGPSDVEFQIAPQTDSDARDSFLTRLRTEIMAGNGPDAFLCGSSVSKSNDFLFRFPQQAMKRHMFLPLDDYIAKAQFMEWDSMIPALTQAGKNQEGQLLLPLTWTLPVTFYHPEDVAVEPSQTATFSDMLEDDALRLASFHQFYEQYDYDHLNLTAAAPFGCLADFDQETLSFTQDQLLRVSQHFTEQYKAFEEGKYDQAAASWQDSLKPYYIPSAGPGAEVYYDHDYREQHFRGFDPLEDVVMAPLYSLDGGYYATITSFAAVNINTKRPDDAFFVLDLLLGREYQQGDVFGMVQQYYGMPPYGDMMQESSPTVDNWYWSEANYKQYEKLRDNLKGARFGCILDKTLTNLYIDVAVLEEPLEETVAEAYRIMTMELAES